jgi:FixJ family two-component response regulator
MATAMGENRPAVFVVGDDDMFRNSAAGLLETENLDVKLVPSALQFVASDIPRTPSCIILDARKPGTSVLQFQSALRRWHCDVPVVCVTDHADIATPSGEPILLTAVRSALSRDAQRRETKRSIDRIRELYSTLTAREREVIVLVSEGLMNKQVAWQLGITEITVKVHRGNATRKMGARSFAELVRMLDALQGIRGAAFDPPRPARSPRMPLKWPHDRRQSCLVRDRIVNSIRAAVGEWLAFES